MKTQPPWVDEYLRILGLDYQIPSLEFLQKIVIAHVTAFPFENVSKLLHRNKEGGADVLVPPVELFLSEHEQFGFGGTCFTLNWHLQNLLSHLGYNCRLIMLNHQHMAMLVSMSGFHDKEYVYVDCGSASPLFGPMTLGTRISQAEVSFGTERVVITHRISKSVYRFTRYRNGVVQGNPLYFDVDKLFTIDDFVPIIKASYEPNRLFTSVLYCHTWSRDLHYYATLKNNRLRFVHEDGSTDVLNLDSLEQLVSTANLIFGIHRQHLFQAYTILVESGTQIFPQVS